MSTFNRAVRERLFGRVAFEGPSGSGKSVTSLLLAKAMAAAVSKRKNVPPKIGVIDTESRSASKYVGETFHGVTLDFDVVDLKSYAPDSYTDMIGKAAKEFVDVLVIDSLSHAWIGEGGALDIKDKIGDGFFGWKEVTPMHNRMVNAILNYPGHVICTMRSKVEYVIEVDEKTKKNVPRKIGVAPLQRAGMEYEFDLYACVDWNHQVKITKSRCQAMTDRTAISPGPDFFESFIEWLESGVVPEPPKPPPPPPLHVRQVHKLLELAKVDAASARAVLRNYGVDKVEDLDELKAETICDRLQKKLDGPAMLEYIAWLNENMAGDMSDGDPVPAPAVHSPLAHGGLEVVDTAKK